MSPDLLPNPHQPPPTLRSPLLSTLILLATLATIAQSVVVIKAASFSPLTQKEKDSLLKAKDFFRDDDSIMFTLEEQKFLTWAYTDIGAFKDFLTQQNAGNLSPQSGEVGSIIYQTPVFMGNYLDDKNPQKLLSFQSGNRFYRFTFDNLPKDKQVYKISVTVENNDCGHLVMFWERNLSDINSSQQTNADSTNSASNSDPSGQSRSVKSVTAYMVPPNGQYTGHLDQTYVRGGKYSSQPPSSEQNNFYIVCPFYSKQNPLIELKMELVIKTVKDSSSDKENEVPSVPLVPPPLEDLEEILVSGTDTTAIEEQISVLITKYKDDAEANSKNSIVTIDENKTEFDEGDPETIVKKNDALFEEQKTVIKTSLSSFLEIQFNVDFDDLNF